MEISYAIDQDVVKEQEDALGISELLKESSIYTKEIFGSEGISEFFEDVISGNINNGEIVKYIIKVFGEEIVSAITVMISILIIVIVNSILNCVTEGLGNKGVSQVAYYAQFILIATIATENFIEITTSVEATINEMTTFLNLLIPVLIALIITTGNITVASIVEPVFVFMTSLIANFINKVALPIIMVSTAFGLISKVSLKAQVDRLAKRFKASTVWVIGILLTIFVTVLSVNGELGKSVDAVTSKTTKAAVSNLVPVVGKILGDAVDSVIGCGNILKNAIGVVGMIVIVAIAIIPIIKLLLLMLVYYMTAALCEPIANEKIVKLLDFMGDTFKILLALVCSMSVMIIIGTTIIIKISNI